MVSHSSAPLPSGCSCSLLQRLDGALASVQEGRSTAEHPVEAALAEVEDLLSYCNDIIGTGACRPLFKCYPEPVVPCMLLAQAVEDS